MLTPEQRRKLRIWKRVVQICMAGAGLALVVEAALLLWPGASRGAKLAVAGLFVELAISAAVVGALGRCPACNSSFEAPPGELVPGRCRACGAELEAKVAR
jgi:hypothetical protein